jgi:hypothetical protein
LEQVNGAIAFYLEHKDDVEQVMQDRGRIDDSFAAAHPTSSEIKEKFQRMRRQIVPRRT